MELFNGRPGDVSGRLPREVRTYDFLDGLGIEYKRTDHEPANNMEACNEIDAVLGVLICKNLFLCNRQKTNFYLLMMPGDKKFKTKELSSQIGAARLSFAGPEDMLKYLDIEPGAVSIMGLMNDKEHKVNLLIDEDVLKGEYLGCHPCVCTSSLKMKTREVIEKYLPATGHSYKTVHLVGEELDPKNTACFGVAGNFTGHLEQAGEAKDFEKVVTAEENAPKAIFPTYIPRAHDADIECPAFLHTFPFDSKRIIYPAGQDKLQIEPECAIVFKAEWKDGVLTDLLPLCFGASNDCSIRREGAKKISLKKNWGACSKGFSSNPIEIGSFDENSPIADYRIASFMVRNGEVYDYGTDSAVRDYSYVFGKLKGWMLDKFNHQEDQGPAENVGQYLKEAEYPEKILVSVGATRYTEFGERNFLQKGDRAVVVLYPEGRYTHEQIREMTALSKFRTDDISVLDQVVEGLELTERSI